MVVNRIWVALNSASEQELQAFSEDIYSNSAMQLLFEKQEVDEEGDLTPVGLARFLRGFASDQVKQMVVSGTDK
ncbi:hypothetical protein [Gymnodinialimonas sp.]